MKTINGKLYYTPKELCKVIDINITSLSYYRRKKKLPFPYIKVLHSFLYPKEEIDKYVSELTILNKNRELIESTMRSSLKEIADLYEFEPSKGIELLENFEDKIKGKEND